MISNFLNKFIGWYASNKEMQDSFNKVADSDQPKPKNKPPKFELGAWTGLASILSPERDIDIALSLGITRLDLFINNIVEKRQETSFDTYNKQRIENFIKKATDAGIDIHLSSWIMPHSKFITTASADLVPFIKNNPIKSLMWDAEEPWTKAEGDFSYPYAASLIQDSFLDLEVPMGVTGIGYTPVSKFGPIADICDYIVPQCYSTNTSGLDYKTVVQKFVKRYRTKFGNKKVLVGLAAYRQPADEAPSVSESMMLPYKASKKVSNCIGATYWSLSSIRRSISVTKFFSSVQGGKK